jgi:hypothetical protein
MNGVREGEFCKTCFVAKGLTQCWGEDDEENYGPVAKYASISIILAVAAGKNRRDKKMKILSDGCWARHFSILL